MPICLPSPDAMDKRMELTVAGWGRRKDKTEISTSCQTNEAMLNEKQQFLQCKNQNAPTGDFYCSSLPEGMCETSPTKSNSVLFQFKSGKPEFLYQKEVDFDWCKHWLKQIMRYFDQKKDPKIRDVFKAKAHRFKIVKEKAGDAIAECYYHPRAGQYGMCETENHYPNWGFCSQSCVAKDSSWVAEGKYEVIDGGIYYEDVPLKSQLALNFKVIIIMLRSVR